MRKTWGFYMAKIKKKGRLYYTLQAFSSVPMLILGLIIMMFSFKTVQSAMYDQVHTELQNMTDMLISSYDMLYPAITPCREMSATVFSRGSRISPPIIPLSTNSMKIPVWNSLYFMKTPVS